MINAKITDIPVPVTRTEHFMYSAITGNESGLKADTQAEMYLEAIKDGDTSDLEELEPRTVLDMYLEARQTGVIDDLPKPRTTSEMLLYQAITGEDLGAKPVSNMDKYLSLLEPNNYDARLEIESEESVIHLTDSKNGVVEVKELEGNTLVNYCTDGTKELTLNGDIGAEGTNVTLTEGVDNGLVDVACEGNTMVNLVKGYINGGVSNNYMQFNSTYRAYYTDMIKPNTVYTIITYKNGNRHLVCDSEYFSKDTKFTLNLLSEQINDPSDFIITKVTTSANAKYLYLYSTNNSSFGAEVIFLEGDWTNKEIPSQYFEGMKSVGECEDNKLEIVSRNKNLFNSDDFYNDWKSKHDTYIYKETIDGEVVFKVLDGSYLWGKDKGYKVKVEKGKQYNLNLKAKYITSPTNGVILLRNGSASITYICKSDTFSLISASFIAQDDYIEVCSGYNNNMYYYIKDIQLEEGTQATSYVPCATNKKEITLSEPLRALPNGVKDKIVKIGGKYYVERNCGEIDLSTINKWSSWGDMGTEYYGFYQYVSGLSSVVSEKEVNVCCATRPCIRDMQDIKSALSVGVHAGKGSPYGYIAIGFKRSELTELTSDGVKEWLSKNPTKVIAQLETPTYELLEIDSTLNTYNDITHISNNSTIPCNMKIKNTGYNVIVKPSTKYTIVTNTNKSTITTPSDVSEYSLVLTGKGTKVKNVMLFEGDYTNKTTPSYFEGMKSSFENNNVEIVSKGKNLCTPFVKGVVSSINGIFESTASALRKGVRTSYISINNDKDYYLSGVDIPEQGDAWWFVAMYDINKKYIKRTGAKCEGKLVSYKNNLNLQNEYLNNNVIPRTAKYLVIHLYVNSAISTITLTSDDILENYNEVQLEQGTQATKYTPYTETKKEILINEPLRGVGDVKDKIVVKNGKLMIERNFDKLILDGNIRYPDWHQTNMYISIYPNINNKTTCYRVCNIPNKALVYRSSLSNMFTTCVTNEAFEKNAREGYLSDHTRLPNIYLCIGNTNTLTMDDFYEYIKKNPIEIIYRLAEPTYEEITPELQKLILKCYDNATLYFNTNIPPKSLISYTANTSNIYKYLDTLKLSKAERDSIINSMERV